MNGIINILKEKGYTSHDAVARLRGIAGERHIGHTGTLDPDAVGVLPICLGSATKVCDILTDRSKEYETVLLLGVETDSQDVSGVVTAQHSIDGITDEMVIAAVESFKGGYEQLPPMFSAVKHEGQKLYDIARQGIEVERKAKFVSLTKLEIASDIVRGRLGEVSEFDSDSYESERGHWYRKEGSVAAGALEGLPVIRLRLKIECSKGTYIRTLCHDIGEKLGCGGCMEQLIRTRVGEFRLEDAITLDRAEAAAKAGELEKYLKAPDDCFPDYVRLDTKPKYDEVLANGNILYFRHFTQYITEAPTPVRVYNSSGEFQAIYEFEAARNRYKVVKFFK